MRTSTSCFQPAELATMWSRRAAQSRAKYSIRTDTAFENSPNVGSPDVGGIITRKAAFLQNQKTNKSLQFYHASVVKTNCIISLRVYDSTYSTGSSPLYETRRRKNTGLFFSTCK